jgi:hypothetical protein
LLTRAVVAVCGAVLILLGVCCFLAGFTAGVALLPILLGLCVLGLAYFLGKQSCLVCAGGVVSIRFGHRQSCRWEEVSEVVDQRVKHGVVSARVCALVRKNGKRLVLLDTGIGDFGALLSLLREQATSRGIPWREERVVK